jgi:uncharacterized protein (DUF697 family)
MTLQEVSARSIINNHALWAGGAGLIPAPALDLIATSGVQYAMIRRLAAHYKVPMPAKDQVIAIVAALIGGVSSTNLAYGVGNSLLKSVPLVGTTLGIVSMSVFGAAVTYALGHVFVMHFETGGNFFNFDPDKLRAHFEQEFRARSSQAA